MTRCDRRAWPLGTKASHPVLAIRVAHFGPIPASVLSDVVILHRVHSNTGFASRLRIGHKRQSQERPSGDSSTHSPLASSGRLVKNGANSAMDLQPPLLRTKLHRPPVTADLVRRERLHERLNRGLDLSVTLVSAPAGYGKSMLVSHSTQTLTIPAHGCHSTRPTVISASF